MNTQFQVKTIIQGNNIRKDWLTTIFPNTAMEREISYSEIIQGNLGYINGVDNWLVTPTTNLPSGRLASIRKQIWLTNPNFYLTMALENPQLILKNQSNYKSDDGEIYDILTIADSLSAAVNLYINPKTGHISKLVTKENDHLFRDIPLVVTYSEWTENKSDNGLLSLPIKVSLSGKGEVWYEEIRTNIVQNQTITTEFDFPPSASPVYEDSQYRWGWATSQFPQMWSTFGVPKNEQQLDVKPIELSKGVYLIKGAMYNSVVVDQGSSVVVLEAPLYPERSEVILNWIRITLHKPVSHLLITHHHFDHIGGVRAYIAAGIPVVLSKQSVAFYSEIADMPSTVVPDAQEVKNAKPTFIPIDVEELALIESGKILIQSNVKDLDIKLKDGQENLVCAIPFKNTHANDMLIFRVVTQDDSSILFQSDLFNPDDKTGRALSPIWTVEFAGGLTKMKLNLPNTTLVGGHSGYAPLTQLYAFVDNEVSTTIKAYVFYQNHKTAVILLGIFILLALMVFIVKRIKSKNKR